MNDFQDENDPIVGDGPPNARVFFSNAIYDKLKWVAQVVLPACALFYIAIAPLWGLPKQEEVSGTIVAGDLLLGTLLGISHLQYKNNDARFDGQITVHPAEEDGGQAVQLEVPDPSVLLNVDEISVKVKRKG